MITYETTLDAFKLLYLKGETAVIENNQIRIEKEFQEPVKVVQERTDRDIRLSLPPEYCVMCGRAANWSGGFCSGSCEREFYGV